MPIDDFRPRLAFRVGVTGHRDLNARACRELRPRVRARLEQIKHLAEQAATESQGVYDDDAPAILRAISPLAEGADRIFAEEAIDLGYDLECPLPFDCREYRNDFTDEISKRQFDELLAKAVAVFELDGSRRDEPAAYALVGQLVLDQCDILLAIWDGKNAKGEGGTAEVVAHAKRRRIPVVWLHSDSGALDTIITSNGSEDCGRVTCGGIDERIKDAVWRLLLPPRNPDPVGSLHLTERLLAPVLVRVWRLYETALTAGLRRSRSPADAPPESLAIHGFQKQYASWDRSANLLAGLYRGAFLLNYALGVLAVFLAILGNATGGHWGWAAGESVTILIVIVLVASLRRRRWHLRTADCRYLAEQFRILCYSYPLGLAPCKPHQPAYYLPAELGDSWVEWHSRAIVRQTPMPTAKVTDDYLKEHAKAIRKWVRGQIHYHDRNAAKLERIDHSIHLWCWRFIVTAFVAALLAWIFHSSAIFRFAEEHHNLHAWLLLFTAGLPAASAAAHAISTQGEFRRLVDRSESMARGLRSSLSRLDPEAASSAAKLRCQTEHLAQVLLNEVADWQVLYRKPAPPPG